MLVKEPTIHDLVLVRSKANYKTFAFSTKTLLGYIEQVHKKIINNNGPSIVLFASRLILCVGAEIFHYSLCIPSEGLNEKVCDTTLEIIQEACNSQCFTTSYIVSRMSFQRIKRQTKWRRKTFRSCITETRNRVFQYLPILISIYFLIRIANNCLHRFQVSINVTVIYRETPMMRNYNDYLS